MTAWRVLLPIAVICALQIAPVHRQAHAQGYEQSIHTTRVAGNTQTTRFVAEFTRPQTVRYFTLINPWRVVMDFTTSRRLSHPIPNLKGTLLSMVRYGTPAANTSRLVMESTHPVRIDALFWLAPSADNPRARLVVDLKRTNGNAFRQTASVVRTLAVSPTAGAQPSTDSATATKTQAGRTSSFEPPQPKPTPPRRYIIVLDAGHGGRDPGAISVSGYHEKHITLNMSKELKAILERQGKYKVVLTRESDHAVALRKRFAIARDLGADLFISLHADSIKSRKLRGASVYTLSEKASDKEAESLAEQENRGDIISGMTLDKDPQISDILITLAQRETMNLSANLAGTMASSLKKAGPVLKPTHRFAGFAVLKAPDVPSILIELGFLSNPYDEKNLRSKKYRDNLARAIARGIDRWFSALPAGAFAYKNG